MFMSRLSFLGGVVVGAPARSKDLDDVQECAGTKMAVQKWRYMFGLFVPKLQIAVGIKI